VNGAITLKVRCVRIPQLRKARYVKGSNLIS